MRVVRYGPQHKTAWNAAIRSSRNGTFLFCRDYLEYHGPRLDDHSLLIVDGPALVAVLPGHQSGSVYVSHGGVFPWRGRLPLQRPTCGGCVLLCLRAVPLPDTRGVLPG